MNIRLFSTGCFEYCMVTPPAGHSAYKRAQLSSNSRPRSEQSEAIAATSECWQEEEARCEGAKPYGSFEGEQIVMERIRDEFNCSNQ